MVATYYGFAPPATVPDVTWAQIRSAFIRARGTRKQQDVARAAGLYQSHISKLEANDKLGPAVEVFVKAVEGLGMPVSQFFAQIERQTKTDLPSSAVAGITAPSPTPEAKHGRSREVSTAHETTPATDAENRLAQAIETLAREIERARRAPAPRTSPRRPRKRSA